MLRRELLATVGVASTAGCLSSVFSKEARLAGVELLNHDDQVHTIHLLVKMEGELVHWSSHEIEGMEGFSAGTNARMLLRDWPDSPSLFTIYARVDDNPVWEKLSLEKTSVGCHGAKVLVDAESVKIWRTGCGEFTAPDEK